MSKRTVEEVAHVETMMRKARLAERERCAKIAEQTESWNQTLEETDHNGIYTGTYKTVSRVTPKWSDGKAIAAAIRAANQ